MNNSPRSTCCALTVSSELGIWMYDVTFCAPADINECKTGRNTCANDTVCFNLEGGYDCRCPHGHNCTGDCIYDSKVKHSGQIWVLDGDRCSVCSCQVRKQREKESDRHRLKDGGQTEGMKLTARQKQM